MLLERNVSAHGLDHLSIKNQNQDPHIIIDGNPHCETGAMSTKSSSTEVQGSEIPKTTDKTGMKTEEKGANTDPQNVDDGKDEDAPIQDQSDSDDNREEPILPSAERRKKLANLAALNDYVIAEENETIADDDEYGDIMRPRISPAAKRLAEESAKIIDKARDYQQELFERAKEENIIAVLDTGSGKTLIACLLIKHVLSQELMDRGQGKSPRTVVFLANSVHLVRQQSQVLTSNLSQPPAELHAGVKEDLWKRETWEYILESHMAIVCTAEVLKQALSHNYISMGAISLLIFDECHHTKKDHPYATIIRDYSLGPKNGRRQPKIFGMTASPMHDKGDMMKASGDLETLLRAKIVTTASMSLLEHAPKAKNEEWIYDRPQHMSETQLSKQVRITCKIEELRQLLQFAQNATATLGIWAADQMWSYIFSEKEAPLLIKRFERSKTYEQLATTEDRQKSLDALNKMELVIKKLELEGKFTRQPDLESGELSSKIVVLARQLKWRYSESPALRTIIFVEQRLTAHLLADCFTKLQFENLKPGVLVGANQSARFHGSQNFRTNKQVEVMEHFRNGWINCIFATNVAEEGIDIPQCSLVVRFDLFKTPIQYMQSRGRARVKDSVYAMLLEQGNEDQKNEIEYAVACEEYMKEFCAQLPPDRLLDTTEARLRRLIDKYAGALIFVTSSGVRCSLNESLVILARFASSLQYTGSITSAVHYELECQDDRFRYAVKLPDGAESIGREKIRGEWMPNKSLAKRSAAWYCCYQLRKNKLLDDNLDSIHVRTQHRNNNARWAVDNTKEKYETKIKPDFWRRGSPVPTSLFATIVRLVPSKDLGRTLKPFVLFSRDQLPELPRFPVYLEGEISTEVIFDRILTEIPISIEQLDDLTTYTLKSVFEDIFHKVYEHEVDAMSYWLAPLNEVDFETIVAVQFEHIVNVPELQIAKTERLTWVPGMDSDLWCNKFLVDKWTGAFRYFSYDVVPGATVDSPVPATALGVGQKGKANVEQFTNTEWKRSKKRNAQYLDRNQPVFDCEMVRARRDFLDTNNTKENAKYAVRCHAVPQSLEIARLPPALAFTLLTWPSILHRLEAYLIALEAFAQLGLQVPAALALEAITATGDNDDDGEQTHSASLRGMGKNYERLEFIGDSLLKMTTTMTVFCIKNKAAESGLHCDRMQMLCNNNLFNVAKDESLKLYQYARTSGMNRVTWYPEGLGLTKGRGLNLGREHAKVYQSLGKKTIADISEAIIGAAYQSGRGLPDRFDMGLKAIKLLVRDELHPVTRWREIAPLYKPSKWQLETLDPVANDLTRKVESSVGIEYHFKYPRLVRSALTHASDTNSPVPDYQRLEFLGDAVLDMVSISWMFNKHEDKNPQWLTEHKMAMVSNRFLAVLAVTLGFDKLIVASNVDLQGHVIEYSRRVREVWDQGKDNIRPDFWTEIENEPKCLSDLVEAFVGALIVDSGFDYTLVERFFEKHILWFFEDLELYSNYANRQPTTFLYQKLTDEFKCTNYAVECVEREIKLDIKITAAVLIHQAIVTTSTGKSSKYARVRASKTALARLDSLTLEQFREEFRCNCKRKADISAEIDRERTIAAQKQAATERT